MARGTWAQSTHDDGRGGCQTAPLDGGIPGSLVLVRQEHCQTQGSRVKLEHISFILTTDYVITVQQKVQDRFEAVYTRIQEGRGIVRQRPVDYLVYRLLEAVILPTARP